MVKRISVKDSMRSPAGEILKNEPVINNKIGNTIENTITNENNFNSISTTENTSVNVSENNNTTINSLTSTEVTKETIAFENKSENTFDYTNENGSVNESINKTDNVISIENKIEKTKRPKAAQEVKNETAISKFLEKNKKVKFEDSHSKDTFWIDNNLLATLKKLTAGNKGIKTKIINESLRTFFQENGIKVENED